VDHGEYGMLPRATSSGRRGRRRAEAVGRTLEIQRLVGAPSVASSTGSSSASDGHLDCDVLVADAGTRCASITGAFVALALAVAKLHDRKLVKKNPFARRWRPSRSAG